VVVDNIYTAEHAGIVCVWIFDGDAVTTIKTAAGALLGILLIGLPCLANADRHDRSERHRSWRGDIRVFHNHDLRYWRRGHWYQGEHHGTLGWWWVIPSLDIWYLYSAPVYPYPNPYLPPTVIEPTPAPDTTPPAPQFWYYCESAKTYYPYVSGCAEGWKKVPATPPDAK